MCEHLALKKEGVGLVDSLVQGVSLVKEGTCFYSGLFLGVLGVVVRFLDLDEGLMVGSFLSTRCL